ncbi:glyoxalase [Echinicola soli]|uniref:Glyoxalase n=1 Tax=Echinicola soli TaxID=2591634 RepID=A0A514CF95_9BACT|nr:glyoxalase [Echinicola soli]QDH78507.1 glyoxalase [Echinicola soli]
MDYKAKSIRTFIGAKEFDLSRTFYLALGFEERPISSKMSLFTLGRLSFYLQDYYVKEWAENSMVFLEVDDLLQHFEQIKEMSLDKQFAGVKVSTIVENDWGNEFFIHDPAGVLWHIGEFN